MFWYNQAMRRLRPGLSSIGLTIVGGFLGLILLVDGWVLLRQQATVRDAMRLADMARLEAAFALLSYETGSFAAAAQGCGQAGVTVDTCALAKYLPTIATVTDPGAGAYVVTQVPTDNQFAVEFRLERGLRGLARGTHTLSDAGLR